MYKKGLWGSCPSLRFLPVMLWVEAQGRRVFARASQARSTLPPRRANNGAPCSWKTVPRVAGCRSSSLPSAAPRRHIIASQTGSPASPPSPSRARLLPTQAASRSKAPPATPDLRLPARRKRRPRPPLPRRTTGGNRHTHSPQHTTTGRTAH